MKYLVIGIDEEQRRLITEKTHGSIEIEHPDKLQDYLTEESMENYTLVYIANDETSKDKKYIAFEEKIEDIKNFPVCVTSITTLPLDTNLDKQVDALNERYLLHDATVKLMRECAKYGIIQVETHEGREEIIVSHMTDNGSKEFRYLLDRFADTLLAPEQNRDFALLVQQLLYAKELEEQKNK